MQWAEVAEKVRREGAARGCEEYVGGGYTRVRRGTEGSTKRHPSVQHLRRDDSAVSLALTSTLT